MRTVIAFFYFDKVSFMKHLNDGSFKQFVHLRIFHLMHGKVIRYPRNFAVFVHGSLHNL